ncbi:MAG: heme lyase CcmF/NrfE family subunit [Alphaproteobacteria bacterium]|nr:heme lyase CcmF/NrfE family subunit [Alphaproteobacteria bacterium]
MMPELGLYCIILAVLVSLLQSLLPLRGAARHDSGFIQAGRRLAYAQFGLVTAAFLTLMYCHVTDDFSVMNVALNSHTTKPLIYKISGTWASHEGSMLLWVFILSLCGALMARGITRDVTDIHSLIRARAVGVQGLMGFGFLCFILFTSNPFARVWPAPENGHDMNPLLQDPGLAFHPPFLYIGYVGFSAAFALAAALLLTREAKAEDLRLLRPWVLAAWSSLTFGIAMGSWWAYYELGWGGYWFWDPVENAALMPWLAGTALVHSLTAAFRRGALMRWTILLSILCFSLSLLGTFLVRSGVLTSVHSFAVDPARGVFILSLLALAVCGALTLYGMRADKLPESNLFSPLSREGTMLANNLFLCTACATLITGTLYPLLLNVITGGIISVGAPYFNSTVLPLLIPVAALMVIGPFLDWTEQRPGQLLRILMPSLTLAGATILLTLYVQGFHSVFGLVGFGLGIWLLAGTAQDGLRFKANLMPQLPRLLAHGGLALSILGMAGSCFSTEQNLSMQVGDRAMAGAYRLSFLSTQDAEGDNYSATRGLFQIEKDDQPIATMQPEQRLYTIQGMPLSHVAIDTTAMGDLYLALGEAERDDAGHIRYAVRFHVNPLTVWIWIGGAVMAAGGLSGVGQHLRRSRTK